MIADLVWACFVELFNGAVLEAVVHRNLFLADLPALYGWMRAGWPVVQSPVDFIERYSDECRRGGEGWN